MVAKKAARKAQASRKPPKAGKPPAKPGKALQTASKPDKPVIPITPVFTRGGKLSVPEDEPTSTPEFPEVTDTRKRLFLQALAQGPPRLGRATRAAGVCQKTVYNWRYSEPVDEAFKTAFDVAWKLAIERAEGELWRRGIEGYETPVYHQGRLVGTEREYDTTAAIFMLKGAKPETYRERFEHSGPDGGPIPVQHDVSTMTDEQLLARIELVKQSLAAPVKLMAEQAVQAKVDELSVQTEAYAKALAERAKNGNGSNNGGNGSAS